MIEAEETLSLNGQEFLRVPIHAKLQAHTPEELPDFVKPILTQATASTAQMYWQDKENPDIVWCSFVLDSEGVNKNFDYMPRTRLLSSYHTAKFKPMDMEHLVKEDQTLIGMNKQFPPVKNTIFGVMTNTALADASGKLLTDKQIAALATTDEQDRDPDEKITVVAWAALYYFLFPKTIQQLVGAIEKGNMYVSMERWLKDWDFLVNDAEGKQTEISRAAAEKNGVFDNWKTRRYINGKPIIRRTLAYTYGGVASTTNPANELSRFIGQLKVGRVKAAASLGDEPAMRILLDRHDEVVRLFAVSSSEAEKSGLRREHDSLHRAIAAYVG